MEHSKPAPDTAPGPKKGAGLDVVRGSAQRLRRRMARDPYGCLCRIITLVTLIGMPALVMAPWFQNPTTYGFHDWDVQTSHRYLTLTSLLDYHEFPGWNPYACGGFPAWGYVESGTIVVSPVLVFYLLFEMPLALRLEVFAYATFAMVGAYMVAGRFTISPGARLLVAVLWGVNGRFGLQVASGHTWHLAYAFLPWALYFYELARAPNSSVRHYALCGLTLAMLVYSGGIYPLPHTAMILVLYAVGMAIVDRNPRALWALALCGVIAIGLSAPKLGPLLATFDRAPRHIESTETLQLGSLWTMLTSREQGFYDRPAKVSPYGWHEWGIYIGAAGAATLAGAMVIVSGKRETVLKLIGAFLVILGFGAFHPNAPWVWMHDHLPVFRSQHVPSRFLYPAILIIGLVAAAGLGRWIGRSGRRRWMELALCLTCAALAYDIGSVAQKPMADAMWMVAPDHIDRGAFHFRTQPPIHYKRRDWAGPMYLSMLANVGIINCYGAPPFEGRGAIAADAPNYLGPASVVGGGTADIVEWSPNRAVLRVSNAGPQALAVYNMNFDPGWSVDVQPGPSVQPTAFQNMLSAAVPPGDSTVTFSYTPPGLWFGLSIAMLTIAALGLAHRRRRTVVQRRAS